jgi:hypothetical protein
MRIHPIVRNTLVGALAVFVAPAAAEWQWSAPVVSVVSDETKDHPRAFLWVPPDCTRVRGVIVAQHNMIEEGILEHPALRKALAEIGFAAVWVTPAFDGNFNFDTGAGKHFDAMITALAEVSGYGELRHAPIVPIGHSAMASYPYHFAAWNPARCAAAISIKGTWPDFRYDKSPQWKDSDVDGVPLLFINGEYEDADGRAAKAAAFRARNPRSPLTMLADAGGGHFDYHDRVVAFIGAYLKKLADHRVPADAPLDAPVALKPIDPAATGWLYDRWRPKEGPRARPAPLAEYTGDAREAFWAFDGELAAAIVAYSAPSQGKKGQLVGYLQDGRIVEQNPKTHQQVTLKFLPIDDGLTFKLAGTFLDTVPEGRPVSWTRLAKDSPIGHAAGGEPVTIRRITGPVVQTAPDTFKIRFNRVGTNNTKRSNDVWFMATHPGDAEYKRAVQQASMRFPLTNKAGAAQSITFPPIGDQTAGAAPIDLKATSSASVPVYYYVREGPAEIDADRTLRFTAIPPRAKFPITVTVVAWQWGRSIDPKLQSAAPVEQQFLIGPGE